MEYNSFYGGRRGASFVIVKRYSTIAEMITAFSQGGDYKTVNYDEYVLIDTENNVIAIVDEDLAIYDKLDYDCSSFENSVLIERFNQALKDFYHLSDEWDDPLKEWKENQIKKSTKYFKEFIEKLEKESEKENEREKRYTG